jgi:hypothetical protein
MSVTTCFGEHYSNSNGDSPLSCSELNTNQDTVAAALASICQAPSHHYEINVSGNPLVVTVPSANLPTSTPTRIAVFVNGNRLYDDALSGLSTGYTVDSVSQITINFEVVDSNILVEYWLI